MRKICITPDLRGMFGGPPSFEEKISAGLRFHGVEVTYNIETPSLDSILVINGTKNLQKLFELKKKGVRVVQRLGNPNFEHRFKKSKLRNYFMAEIRNYIMRIIRSKLADHVIYQSKYVEERWISYCGKSKSAASIIYNGVDLNNFSPIGKRYQSKGDVCLISVEGNQSVENSNMAIGLSKKLIESGLKIELLFFGNPHNNVGDHFSRYPFVDYKGLVPNSELPYYYRGSNIFISTDIIAACPNSVLESLSCGTPVLGYKLGVLPEILTNKSGFLVKPKADLWKQDALVNVEELVDAVLLITKKMDSFRDGARLLAESRYDLSHMVDQYMEVLFQ
ncbi:MAG: glycosyltransferase family 4 protein [Thermodesulfobacteriota bacterium]